VATTDSDRTVAEEKLRAVREALAVRVECDATAFAESVTRAASAMREFSDACLLLGLDAAEHRSTERLRHHMGCSCDACKIDPYVDDVVPAARPTAGGKFRRALTFEEVK
jgi:hypothetical protein